MLHANKETFAEKFKWLISLVSNLLICPSLTIHACKLLHSAFSSPNVAYRLAWLTQRGRVGSKQITACKFLLLSSPSKRYLVPAEKNNLVILRNFADLLATFIQYHRNAFRSFQKTNCAEKTQNFYGILSVMLNEKIWVWTS